MEVGKEAITARDEKLAMVRQQMDEASADIKEIDAPEAEVETETEDTPDTETEQPEEETETEVEEEADSGEEKPQTRDSSLTRELNKIRSQKREAERLREEADAERQVERQTWEAEKARLVEENKKLQANVPPPQPFVEYAKSKGINDPKDVKELYDTFKLQLDVDYGSKLAAIDEKIQTFEKKETERAELTAWDDSMRHFDGEFQKILPSLEADYKPSSEQLSQVYDLLADVAHDQKYADKDLDYVLYKEAEKFEAILGSRKRKGFISRSAPQRAGLADKETLNDEHSRIMALRKEQQSKKTKGDGFDGPVGDTNI